MAFTPKNWTFGSVVDNAALQDLETRLSAYTDFSGDISLPTGYIAQTSTRSTFTQAGVLTNGRILASRGNRNIAPAGVPVNTITMFTSSTPAGSPSHAWACIFDDTDTVVAVSNDNTTAAIAAATTCVYTLTTTWTPSVPTRFGIGWCVSASTMPTPCGISVATGGVGMPSMPPVLGGQARSSLTTPLALGASIGPITVGNITYGLLS